MPISLAFKEKLSLIVFEEYHRAGTHLLNNREVQVKNWLIIEGSAREFTVNYDQTSHEQTQWFWFKNDFLYTTPGFFSQQPVESYVEILEDSHLVYIDFQNFHTLKKTYPEAAHFSELIRDQGQRLANIYINQMRSLNGKERYQWLFKEHPNLFNLARQKDIAYFLGIKPDTLGRLRKSE